jgi:hypothetical protein
VRSVPDGTVFILHVITLLFHENPAHASYLA